MILREILQAKGHVVHSIDIDASLDAVVRKLVRHNCGSLVVMDADGQMVGIITERDILKACAKHDAALAMLCVGDAMTAKLVIGSPNDTIEDTMGLMTDRRIRHLPVVEEDQLLGLISIGDVVKTQHDRLTMENHYLKSYLHG